MKTKKIIYDNQGELWSKLLLTIAEHNLYKEKRIRKYVSDVSKSIRCTVEKTKQMSILDIEIIKIGLMQIFEEFVKLKDPRKEGLKQEIKQAFIEICEIQCDKDPNRADKFIELDLKLRKFGEE